MPSRNQGIVCTYYAWDTNANAYKTGDVGNHTLRLLKDGTEAAPTNSPSEVDSTNTPGLYALALTSAETNFNTVDIAGKSSTANVVIIGKAYGFEQLPIVAPASNGGLLTFGSGVGQISSNVGGIVDDNLKQIAGAMVATSSAQLGVNLVNIAGAAVNTAAAQLGVNVVQYNAQTAQTDANNLPKVDVEAIKAVLTATSTAMLGVNVVTWGGGQRVLNTPPDVVFTPGQNATLQSGSSATTVTLVSGSSNVTDFYKWQTVIFTSGLASGSSATIINYNAATKVATINGIFPQNPSGGDGYVLVANGEVAAVALISGLANVNVTQWAGGAVPAPNVTGEPLVDVNHWRGTQPNALLSNRVDVSVGANQAGVITTAAFAASALTAAVFGSQALTAVTIDTTFVNSVADGLLDRANAIETGVTPRQAWRYTSAAEAGVTAGALTTTFSISAIGNAGTARISATTTASGNRTAVSLL